MRMMNDLVNTLSNSMKRARTIDIGYPVLEVDEFLPPEILSCLGGELGDVYLSEDEGKYAGRQSADLYVGRPVVKSAKIAELGEALDSVEFRDELEAIFDSTRGRGFGDTALVYHRAKHSYHLRPHTDIFPKKISAIIYLGSGEIDHLGWGTEFYKRENDSFSVAYRAEFVVNKAVFFAPQEDLTYHGVAPQPPTSSIRESLLLTYNYLTR